MDTFDFGNPDFSTASSGIDDLNLFPANSAHSVSSHHNAHSDAGSAPVSHHPSPSAAFNHSAAAHSSDHQPGSATHGAAAFLNAPSHAGSPLAFPRNRFDNHASTSPQGSTANQAGSDSGHNRPPSTVGSEINFAGSRHLDSNHAAGSAMQPSHSNQSHMNDHDNNMPQLSIADLQQMLLERERTERIQNMQTALLKQQLDQLARTQQQQQHSAAFTTTARAAAATPAAPAAATHAQRWAFLQPPTQLVRGRWSALSRPAAEPPCCTPERFCCR